MSGPGVGALKSVKPSLSVGEAMPFAVVMVGVVGERGRTASKGFISFWRRPEVGSARGVIWSCGVVGQSLRALDLMYLRIESHKCQIDHSTAGG